MGTPNPIYTNENKKANKKTYLIILNFRGTYFRGRQFRKVLQEFIFVDDMF